MPAAVHMNFIYTADKQCSFHRAFSVSFSTLLMSKYFESYEMRSFTVTSVGRISKMIDLCATFITPSYSSPLLVSGYSTAAQTGSNSDHVCTLSAKAFSVVVARSMVIYSRSVPMVSFLFLSMIKRPGLLHSPALVSPLPWSVHQHRSFCSQTYRHKFASMRYVMALAHSPRPHIRRYKPP